MEKSQILWLEKSFRDKCSVEIDTKQFLDRTNKRVLAVSRIQKLTLEHTRTMLESQAGKHSTAERMLICQLLVDLEKSFSTSTSGMAATHFEQESEFADDQRNLATLLCQTGDYNDALTLLHRIPRHQIGKQDLSRIVDIGTLLCARTKTIPEVLGTDDDPMYSAVFECMDLLVLPYNLLVEHPGHETGFEDFIKDSFMWPWERKSIRDQLKNKAEAPVDFSAMRLDSQFRDGFGHSFLHAVFFFQNNHDPLEIIKESLGSGQENAISQLCTTSPSYAPGLTPLAWSVIFLAGWDPIDLSGSMSCWRIFHALVSFSGRNLCCESSTSTTGHKFCPLAAASRCWDTEVVKVLVQRSTQQRVDITECCLWVMNWTPDIPLEIRGLLMAHLGTPRSAAVNNGNEEGLLE